MNISKLTPRDVDEFSRLVTDVIQNTPYYSEWGRISECSGYKFESIKNRMLDKNFLFLAAKINKRIVGFSAGHHDFGTFWLDWIGIDKNFRKRCIGTGLLVFLEKYLKGKGVHKIWLDTIQTNNEAINFFRKAKFKRICSLKNHWYNQDFYLWGKFL